MGIDKLLVKTGVFLGNLVYKGFEHYTTEAIETQHKLLKKLVKKSANTEFGKKYDFANIHNADDFREKVPLTDYTDYAEYVKRMGNGEKNLITSANVRWYIETSGSSGTSKIVPISGRALWNLQCMGFVAPEALADKYYRENFGRRLHAGTGMLAWMVITKKMPDGSTLTDLCSSPLVILRRMVSLFNTTPTAVMFCNEAAKIDGQYLLLRFGLPNRNVSYIGGMIITLTYSMFTYLEDNWQLLCDDIEKGIISDSVNVPDDLRKKLARKLKADPKRAAELRREFEKGFDASDPIARRIWPNLDWVYGMMGSSIAVYADKVRKYIGDMPIHGIGYGASEGYSAMPVEMNAKDAVLLPRSEFFEFIPRKDGVSDDSHTLLLDEVVVGEEYELVKTNPSGFWRYRLGDVIKVTGFYNNSPRIQFLYRANVTINLIDEKTTQSMLDLSIDEATQATGIPYTGYSVWGDNESEDIKYVLLVETDKEVGEEDRKALAEAFDKALIGNNSEYIRYRMSNTLKTAECHFLEKGTYGEWRKKLQAQGKSTNQIKPVTVINTPEKKEFFFSHIVK